MCPPNIALAPSAQVTVTVSPTAGQPGRLDAMVDGTVVVASTKTPLLDVARTLIAAGADPGTTVAMRHAGSSVECLRARLGVAAGLTVKERDRGIIGFEPWKAYSASPVGPPIDFEESALPECRPALVASTAGALS